MKSRVEAAAAARELLSVGDISDRLGMSRQTVWNWMIYRDSAFPFPVGEIAGSAVYWWPEILGWLKATGRRPVD